MKKKFICAVCGYIYEGDAAPEKCPICKAPASKFSELKDEGETTYATVHKIGDGKPEGVSEEMIQDLRDHFNGECGEAYNIADSSEIISLRAIAEYIAELSDRKVIFEIPDSSQAKGSLCSQIRL